MKQTELHRHLEISIRLSTLLELAQARGLEPRSTSLKAFRRRIVFTRPAPSLKAMLDSLELFQRVLDRPEALERVAREALEDCFAEGTRKVELRFSPGFVSARSGLAWDEILGAFSTGLQAGLAGHPEMQAGLICIAVREQGLAAVERTVEFFLNHRDRLLAFDLAGDERGYPNRLYTEALRPLHKAGARITIHAGEAGGPESVWEALELLKARRIGHGIASIRDPRLLEHLARERICLEVCPLSNWLTSSVPSLKEHPLPELLRAGVPVSINTDDPTVFGSSLPSELQACRDSLGLAEPEIRQCLEDAEEASFL
jgi:adenosine deaminase